MSSRWMRTGAWIFAGVVSGSFAACLIGPENAVGPCTADTDCDDGLDCSQDICAVDGYCDHDLDGIEGDDGEECTDDVCTDDPAGRHPAKADGTACGLNGGLQCMGGRCKCAMEAECGTSTECLTWTCSDGSCAALRADADTPVGGLATADCKKSVCDGAGHVVAVADATDPPADVAGDCKKPGCDEAGNPTALADDADVPADVPASCTAGGCSDGEVTPGQLADNTVCGPATCGGSDPSFQASADSLCLSGVCTPQSPVGCGFFECNDDGNACRTNCSEDDQCTSTAYCKKGDSTCLAKLDPGNPCDDVDQCTSAHCVDGRCCNDDCNGPCDVCNLPGKEGQCSVATGQQAGCPGGQVCNAGGQCKRSNGEGCNNGDECVSGVCFSDGGGDPKICCDKDCSGECRSCEGGKTGKPNGICNFIKDKTDPDDECSGPCIAADGNNCCNGGGVCND